jgi:hypothetical protein
MLPNEILDIIFQYDGRIKYRKGQFVNIINKYDNRYDIIKEVIDKKINTRVQIDSVTKDFYIEINFHCGYMGLCYYSKPDIYLSSYHQNQIEVCFFNLKNLFDNGEIIQIRSYF